MDWHVNKSLREVSGDNPAQLDLYSTTGAKLTQEGISGYNNNWGNCCARDYDLSYTNTAPYAALEIDGDSFAIDGRSGSNGSRRRAAAPRAGHRVPGQLGRDQHPDDHAPTARAKCSTTARSYISWTAGALWKASANTSDVRPCLARRPLQR